MAINVTLTEQKMKDGSTKLQLVSPYSPTLPAKCRALGGRWNADTKKWYFDLRDADRVRSMCVEAFGIDPLAEPDEQPELVTVRWVVGGTTYDDSVWMFGREILRRPSRDERVRLGKDVVLIAGGFEGWGGSRANPRIGTPQDGTIVEIRDVPRLAFDAHGKDDSLTIVDVVKPDAVSTGTAQIGALFNALTPGDRRAVIISMIGNLPASERPALLKELGMYVEQGAL